MSTSSLLTVLLVDDHFMVRQGVRTFLELQSDLEVVGEASSGEEAVKIASTLCPQVILMDLQMPGIGGIEATRQIKAVCPATQIIILTSFQDDENIFPALRAGAISYLLKDVGPDELADAIRKAAQGEARLHPRIAARVDSRYQKREA